MMENRIIHFGDSTNPQIIKVERMHGHYRLILNNKFYSSADTLEEAIDDAEQYVEDYELNID